MHDEPQKETWKPIPGFEGKYEVSDLGRVKSLPRTIQRGGHNYRIRGQILKQTPDKAGRLLVGLYPGSVRRGKLHFVHRLVLEAFVGPRPEGMVCCHHNDVSTDNRLCNLRWDTMSANNYDKVRNGGDHNASRTHCDSGHEYTPDNTQVLLKGGRQCIECHRRYVREYMRRKRSEPKNAGICGQCGKPRDSAQFKCCSRCREYARAYRARRNGQTA